MYNNAIPARSEKVTIGIVILEAIFIISCAAFSYSLFLNINSWVINSNQTLGYDVLFRVVFTCAIATLSALSAFYLFMRKKRAVKFILLTAGLYLAYIILSQLIDILYRLTVGFSIGINLVSFRLLILFLPSILLNTFLTLVPITIIIYAKRSRRLAAHLSVD